MMHCPGCNMPTDEEGTFCGHCGQKLPPESPYSLSPARAPAQEVAYVKPAARWQESAVGHVQIQPGPSQSTVNNLAYPRKLAQTPFPLARERRPNPFSASPPLSFSSLRPVSGTGRNIVFLGIILTILLVGVLAGALTLYQHKQVPSRYTAMMNEVQGTATFSDSQEHRGDTGSLNIRINGLASLPGGSHYAAWIVDEETERILPLGTLQPAGGNYTLNFQHDRVGVLSMGNKLEVTQESAQTTLPTGHVLLSAHLPVMAFMHIKHLLVSFPTTPGNIGLLVGLREQEQQLYNQTQQLKDTDDAMRVQCIAQNVVNLIEGHHSAQSSQLPAGCAPEHIANVADGFGLLGSNNDGYVAGAAAHASLAATQPDTTDTIRMHARQVIGATDDLKLWLKVVDRDAHALLANPNDVNSMHDMIELSARTFNGVDLNHNGHIDPVPGEAGASSAYQYGQQMATLTLTRNT